MTATVTYPETHPLEGQPVEGGDALIQWASNADLQAKLTRLHDGDPYMPASREPGTLWERVAESAAADRYDHPLAVTSPVGGDDLLCWADMSLARVEVRGEMTLWQKVAISALPSCGYDDATGEPYAHDIHPDGDCRYCGIQVWGN